MTILQKLYNQVDDLRAEAREFNYAMSEAYSLVLGLISAAMEEERVAEQFTRHYSDAEIAERLATAGSHPHGDARDVQMLRQLWDEKNR